jgi:hypothetical protein
MSSTKKNQKNISLIICGGLGSKAIKVIKYFLGVPLSLLTTIQRQYKGNSENKKI